MSSIRLFPLSSQDRLFTVAAYNYHRVLAGRLVGMMVGSISLAHLGMTNVVSLHASRLEVTGGQLLEGRALGRAGASLETRLAIRFDRLWVASRIRLQGTAFFLVGGFAAVALLHNIIGSLDELQGQTIIHVPDDVAVHEPGTRVVSLEPNHRITGRLGRVGRALKHNSVTTRGVVKVQGADQRVVPG